MSERHLTPTELAERYGVPVNTVYMWNHRGGGPPYMRIGKHVRYRISDVEAWENAKYQTPEGQAAPKKATRVASAG